MSDSIENDIINEDSLNTIDLPEEEWDVPKETVWDLPDDEWGVPESSPQIDLELEKEPKVPEDSQESDLDYVEDE